jgi:hypothetical protein
LNSNSEDEFIKFSKHLRGCFFIGFEFIGDSLVLSSLKNFFMAEELELIIDDTESHMQKAIGHLED